MTRIRFKGHRYRCLLSACKHPRRTLSPWSLQAGPPSVVAQDEVRVRACQMEWGCSDASRMGPLKRHRSITRPQCCTLIGYPSERLSPLRQIGCACGGCSIARSLLHRLPVQEPRRSASQSQTRSLRARHPACGVAACCRHRRRARSPPRQIGHRQTFFNPPAYPNNPPHLRKPRAKLAGRDSRDSAWRGQAGFHLSLPTVAGAMIGAHDTILAGRIHPADAEAVDPYAVAHHAERNGAGERYQRPFSRRSRW